MAANHRNWQQLGRVLTERMQELGYTGERLMRAAEFPSRTYMTSILSGRARLILEYVKPIAQALDLDEDQLFWTALEGMLKAEDVVHFREFFHRLKVRKRKKKQR
jgi:transcriptional regulator with XRE-family HTH domain